MASPLPPIPAPHKSFIKHLGNQRSAHLRDLVRPYNEYEAKLREVFAQHRDHPAIQDPHVNAVPVFDGHEKALTIRARDPAKDPEAERYIMPLENDVRLRQDEPATVGSLKEFRNNFNLFSEQALVDMDWNNVVAAGSSVATAMLPVPKDHKSSKRALREYYHQKLAPSSDVDLFLWGLNEAAATKKIAQIEECVRNSILAETVTIRTKAAITIASQYPTRHVQIVLRLYKSVSEILTGFDVDSSCFAYDGSQVYATPRGVASFCSQANTVDLSRRSPSYESRLAKYAHRGFEIYCASLDRRRIDPTVYDRSFVRTMGLARLLVLERLPTEADRDRYLAQRRQERGRPPLDTWRNRRHQLPGNMKDNDPEDIPEWDFEADVSNYHTFTVPYGPKYHARKIERLLYVKDMLLNAEWNHRKDRTVDLHRHPCFIGDVASIIHDCCGECPEPKSDEEIAIAEEERKIYVHGEISFMKDDPGRQTIGSFNPLTAEDWTDMAYLGNTQVLAGHIIDGDLDAVKTWCTQEDSDVNKRDHTGRTPLQLAVLCQQSESAKVLIDAGARITARVADGFTALHMAAAAGNTDIIKLLSQKSDENEEQEAKKEEARKAERKAAGLNVDTEMDGTQASQSTEKGDGEDDDDDGDSDAEMVDAESADNDETMTQGSFVKVGADKDDANIAEDDGWGPDVYDANVLAWDVPVSPLHVAILCGHTEAIDTLVSEFGADVLLPVKLHNGYQGQNKSAILNLVLASHLPSSKSPELIRKLISLGAKPSQSDNKEVSAFHGAVIAQNVSALKAMVEGDKPSAERSLQHIALDNGTSHNSTITSPLLDAIRGGNTALVNALLDLGAQPVIKFEDYREVLLRVYEEEKKTRRHHFGREIPAGDDEMRNKYLVQCEQPVVAAGRLGMTEAVLRLLDLGADVNSLTIDGGRLLAGAHYNRPGTTLLDVIKELAKETRKSLESGEPTTRRLPDIKPDSEYLGDLELGTYQYTLKKRQAELARLCAEGARKQGARLVEEYHSEEMKKERAPLKQKLISLSHLVAELERRGAKGFYALNPDARRPDEGTQRNSGDAHKRKHEEIDSPPAYKPVIRISDNRTTDRRKAAYIKLFEAVWRGDIETIKSLTLRKIDDGEGDPIDPIPIARADLFNLNPFSIAVFQGNKQLAQVVLDITAAQYQSPRTSDEPKRRFRIRGRNSSDYDEEEYDEPYENNDDIPVDSEIVDENITINDLAQLGTAVASSTKPIELFRWKSSPWIFSDLGKPLEEERQRFQPEWKLKTGWNDREVDHKKPYCTTTHSYPLKQPHHQLREKVNSNLAGHGVTPLTYGIVKGDLDMVKFLLRISWRLAQAEEPLVDDPTTKICAWSSEELESAVNLAICQGKNDIAELLITECGAGMPMFDMLKDIVIPEGEEEKPQYYQGLKLYGKHKKAWAEQAAGNAPQAAGHWQHRSPAPFLRAVYFESRKNIEFWQSDACVRLYTTFGERHQHLKEIQRIAKKHGGWNSAVTEWLGLRRDLSLHCAVIRGARKGQRAEVVDTTKYILSTAPNSLNKKSLTGRDPLWLAFYYRQVNNARLFIEAGADQNTRDHGGMNIMHAMLSQGIPVDEKEETEVVGKMEELLKLVDARMLPTLFTDRCSFGPTGLTPFAYWMQSQQKSVKTFELLDKWMPADVYSMFDGSGQTPLHKVVVAGHGENLPPLLAPILDAHPELLGIENGFGQTPLDQARTFYLRSQTNSAPQARGFIDENGYSFMRGNTRFRTRYARDGEHGYLGDNAWQVLSYEMLLKKTHEHEAKHGPNSLRRKMISVREASEVAKRLAETQRTNPSPYRMSRRNRRAHWEQINDEPHDEVDRWHGEHGTVRRHDTSAPREQSEAEA